MRFVKHIKNERGMALVTTMLFLVILFFLGVAAYMMTSSDLRISGYYRQSQEAFYVAESGIQEAKGRLKEIYKDQILKIPSNKTASWRYYIGDSTLATELKGSSCTPDDANLSGMDYAIQLRLKTVSDPNSWGVSAASDILYWNGSAETPTYSNGAYPIFIATSLGAKGDARKKIIAEIRGNTTFVKAPAALYVTKDLTKNGTPGFAEGYNPNCPAGESVPDVMTSILSSVDSDADEWKAGTSNPAFTYDPPELEEANLVVGKDPPYDVVGVMTTISSNYDQLVYSGNNQTFGTADEPGIFYSDGNWTGNNLDGYGILAIKGDFITSGNITWHGLIIVTGESTYNGGGTRIVYGAVIADSDTVINGTPIYQYDCSVMNNLMASTPKFRVYSWIEDL